MVWQKILKESNRCSHNRAMIEVCHILTMENIISYNVRHVLEIERHLAWNHALWRTVSILMKFTAFAGT